MPYSRRLAALVSGLLLSFLPAANTMADGAVLFRDVRIFDGVSDRLARGHLLVEGETIARISHSPIEPPAGATVIEGRGRILSPGFIDLHAHLTLSMPKDQTHAHPWVVGALAGDAGHSP